MLGIPENVWARLPTLVACMGFTLLAKERSERSAGPGHGQDQSASNSWRPEEAFQAGGSILWDTKGTLGREANSPSLPRGRGCALPAGPGPGPCSHAHSQTRGRWEGRHDFCPSLVVFYLLNVQFTVQRKDASPICPSAPPGRGLVLFLLTILLIG